MKNLLTNCLHSGIIASVKKSLIRYRETGKMTYGLFAPDFCGVLPSAGLFLVPAEVLEHGNKIQGKDT